MVEQITDRSIATIYHPERNVDVLAVVLDVQKIVVRLGWTSRISLAEGIERTWWSLRP
jgi:nucleoside-diphosphate-sugar epimerase